MLFRASLVVLGATVAVSALSFAAGLAVRSDVGCGACHEMQAYQAAAKDSMHGTLECAECHATPGTFGLLADGLRAFSWVAASGPALTEIDSERCLACHENVREEVLQAAGISVRHSDFLGESCSTCHGGTAHKVESRWYRVLEMDDCMSCHRSSGQNPEQCGECHVPDPASRERREGPTAWRATHGPGWKSTHRMGTLTTCVSCHIPGFCTECHGVRVPHPADWLASHGPVTVESSQAPCETCHDAGWCTGCHGVDMPHEPGFLPAHGLRATQVGEQVCARCHNPQTCVMCHYESSHPNLPGIGMGHEGG